MEPVIAVVVLLVLVCVVLAIRRRREVVPPPAHLEGGRSHLRGRRHEQARRDADGKW